MKRLPIEPTKPASPTYRQIWRVVDGAVDLALSAHPEYLNPGKKVSTIRNSIVKRVVGALHGYAEQSAWVRSGSSPADDKAESELPPEPVAEGSAVKPSAVDLSN